MKKRKLNTDLIPELRQVSSKLIEQIRIHIQQMCIIAGVISAFLMPLYASNNFSDTQHTYIALSLASFLVSILIGCLYVSIKLSNDQKGINKLRDIIETNNLEGAESFEKKHTLSPKEENSPDIISWFVDILFCLGIIFLIAVLIITEIKGF